ncbi:MAG: glycosyltransferase family 4 protein, partial [candidate division NC10 bacterium]
GATLWRFFRTLDAVIAPSPSCRAELVAAGFPDERIHVIANGVDTQRFRPGAPEDSRAVLPPWSGPVVVFAGRLIDAKGVLELMEAWPRVLHAVPEAHLVVLGGGPLEGELHRRAGLASMAGRVHLLGEVSDVRPYLRFATGFVFPSWAEGLPNSLLEAMAMGLPCVATDIGPIRGAVTDGMEGLLVPVRAPSRLAAALATVLGQPDLAARLGQAARMRVEREFSLAREVGELEALYRDLSLRRGRGRRHA